jgi:3'(2'), 5'-bisphosphate nucleotidase
VFIALSGSGAWQLDVGGDRGFLSHVRLTTPTPRAFRVCESVESAHSDHEAVAHIVHRAGASPATLRVDGQTKYALVARGDAEAYLRVPVPSSRPDAIWDHAAGSLLAEEAGATVTDLRGARLDFRYGSRLIRNAGIVCAHPALHERLLSAIAHGEILPATARVVHTT